MKKVFAVALIGFLMTAVPVLGQSQIEGLGHSTTTIGDFTYVAVDDFTDKDRSVIVTHSIAHYAGTLGWRCLEDGLNVVLHLGGYMGGNSNGDVMVRYRFDRDEPSGYRPWRLRTKWPATVETANEMAWIRMNKVDAFTRAALDATGVVIEAFDPLDGESRQYAMRLNGLKRAIQRLPCARRFR